MGNPYQIDRFLLRSLRDADGETRLLSRFLLGPQAVMDSYWESLDRFRLLNDYRRCPAEYLKHLKDLVGITDDMVVRMDLDDAELRRFVSVAVLLWKLKGTAAALRLGARVLSGKNVRVLSWFHRRSIVGERSLEGEESPEAVRTLPGVGDASREEYITQVQVGDGGTVNRTALEYLLNLLRPSSERFDVAYYDFLDVGMDGASLWDVNAGELDLDADGTRVLRSDSLASVKPGETVAWEQYHSSLYLARGAGAEFHFDHQTAAGRVRAVFDGSTLELRKLLSGVETVEASGIPVELLSGVYYTFQSEVSRAGADLLLALWVDGRKVTETRLTGIGAAGYPALGSAGGECRFQSVLIFQDPLVVRRVGPNP